MPPRGANVAPPDVRRNAPCDQFDHDVDLITVQRLLGNATIQPTAQDDRHSDRAKKQAVGTLHVPYRRGGVREAVHGRAAGVWRAGLGLSVLWSTTMGRASTTELVHLSPAADVRSSGQPCCALHRGRAAWSR